MKIILQVILAVLALGAQPILFETSDWGINYLNAHPTTFKIVPLTIGLVCSFLFTCNISPVSNALKPPVVKGTVNPFWGWFAVCLVINVVFNMMIE